MRREPKSQNRGGSRKSVELVAERSRYWREERRGEVGGGLESKSELEEKSR